MSLPPPEGPTPPGPTLPPSPYGAPYPTPAAPSGPGQPPRPWEPEPSRTMAGWALGLAIVPCVFGITTLVGLGLGITVLVRSRDGRNHGKGLGIAAVVVASAWIVVGIVAVALGVVEGLNADPERDRSGEVTSSADQSVLKIRVGDCFDYPELLDLSGDESVESTVVEGLPCGAPHQFEAYLEFDLPDGDYPGLDQVEQAAADGCFAAFKDFVGIGYVRSTLEPYFLHPTTTTWRLLDDRTVTCLITDPDVRTTGSLRDSGR